MSETARNATRPYGGYERVLSTKVDHELQQVERDTPGGEYLRRFWHPVALTADIKDLPLPIKILGEELVVFRDKSGDYGLLERYCSHRRTSLEFGLIVEHGLRCAYHGWHYGVDGSILDVPGERVPGTVAKKLRICQGAYPVREYRGLLFAYMGPPDDVPAFPDYDFMHYEAEEYQPFIWHNPCNWVQVRENTQDPIHLTFLHTMFDVKQFGDYAYDVPIISAHETPIGQITTSVRRVHDIYYCRVNELILPNLSRVPDGVRLNEAIPENKTGAPGQRKATTCKYKRQLPSTHGLGLSIWTVPNDSTNAMQVGWLHLDRSWDAEAKANYLATITFGQTGDRSPEERHRNPGDWDAWVAQGAMTIHENECLTAADVGIAMFRRQLRKGIRAVAAGEEPKGRIKASNGPMPTYGYALTTAAPTAQSEEDDIARKREFADRSSRDILELRAPKTDKVLELA